MKSKNIVPSQIIEQQILLIRNEKVMLSFHLAKLYGVETRVLNQAVKRNQSRFPEDFVFRLTEEEAKMLVSQNVIPHKKYLGGSLPFAFTEQGAAMLCFIRNIIYQIITGMNFLLYEVIDQNFRLVD